MSLPDEVAAAENDYAPPVVAGKPESTREAALTVTVVKVASVDLARTITVNGAIHAWQEIVVAPEVGGYRVAEVHVDVGDTVTSGQELVRMSSTLLEADVASKQAMIKQRQAELINANAALRRAQSLMEKHVLSEADLDRLNSEALAAQARLESARADLDSSAVRLQFTRVIAPDAGIITSRTVTVGQLAQAGAEMLRLMRQSRVEWRGEVPEARLAELQTGQKVTVRPAGGESLTGAIRVVAPTINTNNRMGLVYVDIDTPGSARPGMFASGDIEISRGPGITVPLSSLVSADGYNFVYILHPDRTVERQKVETGIMQDSRIEVISGVSEGELVVEKGAAFLKDG
ncbi:MAG TPA: efflux RND transporter periplasmic adaptor subunit, partial [Candidatus Glassbacteria bacterium]|nr:efflux RND transporter periplasmic adaptor subunit [Candidatus Glassbacteria bacterium]